MRRPAAAACLYMLSLPALAILAGSCSFLTGGISDAKELQHTGVPAQAKILAIEDTGETINDDPVIRLVVDVTPPDRPPFQATIKRLLVSRLEIPQFQPGTVIPVRFDPQDPSRISYDLGPPKAARTGDPFIDNFTASPAQQGALLVPPPPAPALYRGGGDDQADLRSLLENGYLPLGVSTFQAAGPADAALAAAQGKRLGAAVVVLYGETASGPGGAGTLDPLPFHTRQAGAAGQSEVAASGPATIGALPPRARDEHTATYWGRMRPPVLGIMSRPLNDGEKTNLMHNDGMVVVEVTNGSPAAAAHIQEGDVMLAIDGKPILDYRAVPAFLDSIAGQKVRIDLLRNGAPLSVMVQLNASAH